MALCCSRTLPIMPYLDLYLVCHYVCTASPSVLLLVPSLSLQLHHKLLTSAFLFITIFLFAEVKLRIFNCIV